MNFVLRHLELIFTAAGLLVISGVTLWVRPGNANAWSVAAITATVVGVVHGVLFWIIRSRQREVRRAAIEETQQMLGDVVINQLAVIRLSAELQQEPSFRHTQLAVSQLHTAILEIKSTIANMSEESLARWQRRYDSTRPPT